MHLRPLPLLLCPLGVLLGLALAAPACGQTVIDYNFDDDEVEMDISVTVGPEVYTFSADLHFDDVDNLTEECLGVSVQFLDAAAVAAVNARLPRPSQQVDPAFPLLLRIEPPAVCGLAFRGDVDIEIHTTEVLYAPGSGYRLFKSPVGGAFDDITAAVLPGSVRATGSSGRFSDILLGLETVQDFNAQVTENIVGLRSLLASPGVSAAALSVLDTDLDVIEAAYAAGQYAAAFNHVLEFEAHAESMGGVGVPHSWQAGAPEASLEGELLARSGPLRFALARLAGGP